MSKTAEFFFDFGSPASYLAWTQLPAITQQAGAEIIWQPMLLGAVFKATGNQSPAMIPSKGRYMFQDLARFAKRYQVEMNFNPHFPINTITLMRGAAGYLGTEHFARYVECVFRAMWVDKHNLGDPQVLGEVLAKNGFDPQAFLAMVSDEAVKERLKTITEDAIKRGAFGAPTMFVGEQLFFGQDRLDFVREALANG